MTERIKSATFSRQPIGTGRMLVTLDDAARGLVVPADVGAALETLRAFATVDEHERELRRRIKDGTRAEHACRLLRDLAASGALLRESVLVAQIRGVAAPRDDARTTIRTLAVVTCDRPAALRTALTGWLANATRGDRIMRVVVADDSRDAAVGEANRALVADVCAPHGAGATYLDRVGKAALAERLARAAHVPEDIVRFALLGDDAVGPSIGANRNALLLACGDAPFLSFDDDVQACAAMPPRVLEGSAIAEGDAAEWRFFRDRADALEGVTPVDVDLIAEHEALLGASPATIVRRAPGSVGLGAGPRGLLRDLREGGGRIITTVTGVFGDSGMYSGAGLLFATSDAGRAQLTADAETFARATRSREVLRAVPRVTIAPTAPFMSPSFALDPRAGIPPFLPVLRNEDGVFGATIARCHLDAYAAHLPLALLHASEPGRAYVPDRIDAARVVRFSDVLLAFLSSHPFEEGAGTFAGRLRVIGAQLRMLGDAPLRDHAAFLRALLSKAASMRAQRIQLLLERHADGPEYWLRDLRAHLRALQESVVDPGHAIPFDLRTGRDAAQALEVSRSLCARFGRLCEAWPDLMEAALSFRASER